MRESKYRPSCDVRPTVYRAVSIACVSVVYGAMWTLQAIATAGGVCPVPSVEHATIQGAIDDLTCASIVLNAESYTESIRIARSLSISGAGSTVSTVDGRVWINGTTFQVNLNALGIRNGCPSIGLQVSSGARVNTSDVTIGSASVPCAPFAPIFEDGFESGDLSAWSTSQPILRLSALYLESSPVEDYEPMGKYSPVGVAGGGSVVRK